MENEKLKALQERKDRQKVYDALTEALVAVSNAEILADVNLDADEHAEIQRLLKDADLLIWQAQAVAKPLIWGEN